MFRSIIIMNKFCITVMFCCFCFLSHESMAQLRYVVTQVDSVSWSQAKSGIYLSVETEEQKPDNLFCYDEDLSDYNSIVPDTECELNIVLKTYTGGSLSPSKRKVIRLDAPGIGVKSTNRDVANYLSSLRYISRDKLNVSESEMIRSVCFSYTYKDTRMRIIDEAFRGICASDPVIPPVPQPESCDIMIDNNAVDFGNIGDKEFSDAGIGNKPESVTPQHRTIKIQCTNNFPEVTRGYLLLTSDRSDGKMIISDNTDVGFIIKKENGDTMYPNDFSKLTPLDLNAEKSAQMSVEIQPVSATGKTPKTGLFSATAVMDIIFD